MNTEQKIPQPDKPVSKLPIPQELIIGLLLVPTLLLIGALFIWWRNTQLPKSPDSANKTSINQNIAVNREARKNALEEKGGKVPQGNAVATAGKETLYGQDLNYELLSYNPQVFDTNNPIPADIRVSAMNKIINQSLMLQIAESKNIVKLDESFFNNPKKDYRKRNEALTKAQGELIKQVENRMTVAGIFLYFNNPVEGKSIPADAKEKTKQKIESMRADILAKKITIEEAGKKLALDKELQEIDPGLKANAYGKYPDISKRIPLKGGENKVINDAVWSLKKGEVSQVLLGVRINDETQKTEEAFWAVFQIKDRTGGASDSFDEWFTNEKKNYTVQNK